MYGTNVFVTYYISITYKNLHVNKKQAENKFAHFSKIQQN